MLPPLKLIISGDDSRLNAALSNSERRMLAYGRKTARVFRRLGTTMNMVSTRYLTRFNAILGGAAMVMAGKKVIDFDARLARLAITSGRTGKEFFKLKGELFDIAQATHQDPGELIDYIGAIVEKTGDYDYAVNTLRKGAIVAAATGASLANMGATVANLMDKMGISADQAFEALDIMNIQAKAGAVEFSNFAGLMDRLTASTGRFNLKGLEGVRVLGAWMQEAKKASGSAEEATTGIESAISEMLDPNKVKLMRRFGFNPIDVEASKKAGVTVMKDLGDVIKGIITATRGDEMKLGELFGQRSIRAFLRIAEIYRQTGTFKEFDYFIRQGGDGVETMEDFAFWSEQTAAKIRDFRTQLSQFANESFAGPIEKFTKALDFLNRHPVIAKGGIWTLIGLGGGMLMYRFISGVTGMFRGIGGVLKGAGAVPVRVVNGGFTAGIPGMGGGRMLKAGGRLGSAALGLAMNPYTLAVLAGTAGGYAFYHKTDVGRRWGNYIGEKTYDAAPGWFQRFIDRTAGVDELNRQSAKLENKFNVNIIIDKDLRVTTEVDDVNTHIKPTVNPGRF